MCTCISYLRKTLSHQAHNKKNMTDPTFLDLYVKGPTFLTPRYMRFLFFFAQRFFGAACSLGIQ